jgi:phytanoyl-CoA hydroxylase
MQTVTSQVRGLNSRQIDFFHREGYLVVEDMFTAEDLQPAIDDIQRAIDEKVDELLRERRLSQSFAEYDFEHRLAEISRETPDVARSMWNGTLHGPGFFRLIIHPKLLDVAESVCGPELIASSVYRLRPKIPHYDYGAVPWHQDSAYFESYCDQAMVLTVWIPLVDANEENGCLWVIPRVHQEQIVPHRLANGKAYLEIAEEHLPVGDHVCCPVPKGGVLLLTNRTPHGSFENRTEIVRWSMDLRYQSAALPTNAKITRLPGEATSHGLTADDPDFVPVACYPPEADFLVRSTTRPSEVLRTAEEFAELRHSHVPAPVSDRWGKWWLVGADKPSSD